MVRRIGTYGTVVALQYGVDGDAHPGMALEEGRQFLSVWRSYLHIAMDSIERREKGNLGARPIPGIRTIFRMRPVQCQALPPTVRPFSTPDSIHDDIGGFDVLVVDDDRRF